MKEKNTKTKPVSFGYSRQIQNNPRRGGFTLIELLISISIIAILTGVIFAVLNPIGIQKKTRDSQRVADLSKAKVALANYFSDNRRYPIYTSWTLLHQVSGLAPNYINNLPIDPRPSGVDCQTPNWRNYFYKSDSSGSSYVLAANLEVGSSTPCPVASICSSPCGGGSSTIYYTTED